MREEGFLDLEGADLGGDGLELGLDLRGVVLGCGRLRCYFGGRGAGYGLGIGGWCRVVVVVGG